MMKTTIETPHVSQPAKWQPFKRPVLVLITLLLAVSGAALFLDAPAAEATGPGGLTIPEGGFWFVTSRAAAVQRKCTDRYGASAVCVEWCNRGNNYEPSGTVCCVREADLSRNSRTDCLR